jgi:hypothetical protein
MARLPFLCSVVAALALACGGTAPSGAQTSAPGGGGSGGSGGSTGGSGGSTGGSGGSTGGAGGSTSGGSGGSSGGTTSGGGSPGGASASPTPAPARVTLTVNRTTARDDSLDRLDLDVARVLVVLGATPATPEDHAPCAAAGAAVHDVAFKLGLDLKNLGPTQLGRVDLDAGTLGEVRLLLRSAEVDDHGRGRHGRGRLTCVDDDGAELIVVRLVPGEHIDLDADEDEELEARFDDRVEVEQEACQLPDDHGGKGDDGCEAEDEAPHGLAADHGGGDDQGGDNGGGNGGGPGTGRGTRVFIADQLPLFRTR